MEDVVVFCPECEAQGISRGFEGTRAAQARAMHRLRAHGVGRRTTPPRAYSEKELERRIELLQRARAGAITVQMRAEEELRLLKAPFVSRPFEGVR